MAACRLDNRCVGHRVFLARGDAQLRPSAGYPLLDRIAPISHYGFYVLVVLMVATGFATAILAGLPAIVFRGSGAPLPPRFMIFPTFVAHGWLAAFLAGFIAA